MQRRNLIVELITAFVEAAAAACEGILHQRRIDAIDVTLFDGNFELLNRIQQSPPIAIGTFDQRFCRLIGDDNALENRIQSAS